ncbi:MAG: LytR/AlgR family response regulator transcription factor [Chitinophagaceae bacterium]
MPQFNDFIFIKSEYKLVRVDLSTVLYFSGLRDYTQIYCKGKPQPITTLQNLKEFEAKLHPDFFVRVHRSFIVSVKQVDTVCKNELTIQQHNIPIGNAYRAGLQKVIDLYM